jgi:hypothetical protein
MIPPRVFQVQSWFWVNPNAVRHGVVLPILLHNIGERSRKWLIWTFAENFRIFIFWFFGYEIIMTDRREVIIAMGVLGLCLIIATFIFSTAWKQARSTEQTIEISGSARKAITSDLATLGASINAFGGTQGDAYRNLESQKPTVLGFLASKGFPKDKVTFSTVSNYPVNELNEQGYSTGNVRGYNFSQRFEIQSPDVNLIKAVSLELTALAEQGISLNVESPQYLYTKLQDVKAEVQAEAAKDAMSRAKKIAEATGSGLGTIRSARLGVLQITPKNSTEISDYGMNDVSAIEKEITATINASFELE